MDDLDGAILRELLRERHIIWGGWDPRLGTSEIADRLGVDRTTVWSRLKSWKEVGFLLRLEVLPNPCLFGAGLAGGDLRVGDPREKEAVIERVQLVDGVLSWMDQVGPYVILLYAISSQAALDRCTRLLGELPGIEEVSTCIPLEPPETKVEPTRTDWRIIAALREHPDAQLQHVAEAAGVSTRTFRRRFAELLEAEAIWSFPLFDFSKYRGAVMARYLVMLEGTEAIPTFVNTVRQGLDSHVWIDEMNVLPPGSKERVGGADVYCQLGSAAEADGVQEYLLGLERVVDVEVFFPKKWEVVGGWFDERIGEALEKAEATASGT